MTVDNPFAAADVGTIYDHGRPFHHPRTLAHIRPLVGDAPVNRALDVACGTGMSTVALAEYSPLVVGLDISPEMMRAARHAPGVSYLFANAERTPFPTHAFDAVTCSSGVHWFDRDRFFDELHRILRPQGWVALYDHYFIRMRATPGFKEWVDALFERFPLPPRNKQVGDPRAETPPGFELIGNEQWDDDIPMTLDQMVDYQVTVSHCVAAVERGTPRAEVQQWLHDSLAPLFDEPVKTVRFFAAATLLRPVA